MSLLYSEGAYSVNPADKYTPECTIAIFNGYSEFKLPIHQTVSPYSGGGKKRSIKDFSARARKNMLKNLFSLSLYPSLFITLTYPNIYPASAEEWKRHLDNFFRSLRRDFPSSWFFWKLEPQKRGAPHYHLIGEVGTKINIHVLRKYIAELWFRVCGTGDIKHFRAGTQADYINDSIGKMRAYVCKYVGKADQGVNYDEWAQPGRFWGIHGRENLPPILASIIELSAKDFSRIKRLVRRWLKRLSPSSRKYASRLKAIPSFHILAPHELIQRMVEYVIGCSIPPYLVFESEGRLSSLTPIFD